MQGRIQEVQIHLEKLIKFYNPMNKMANSHLASIFAKDVWNQSVPENIRNELKTVQNQKEFLKVYPEIMKSGPSLEFARNHPNLVKFLNGVKDLSITKDERYLKSLDDLESLLSSRNSTVAPDFDFFGFMTDKKFHEVKVTTKLAANLSYLTKTSHMIDVGGGKGYLSWILALNHRLKVLSLDASQVKTCGALKASDKVASLWTKWLLDGSEKSKEWRRDFVRKHYKSDVVHVTPETDVRNLVRDKFQEEPEGLTLTGLHTCGNLAPTCLRMFVVRPEVFSVINIGCCYHFLSEEFLLDDDVQPEVGYFPMSQFLRLNKFSLGRNAKMLSSQSLEKLLMTVNTDQSITSLFYRAILETVLCRNVVKSEFGKTKAKIGKLGKKVSSFHDYMVKAIKQLDINLEVSEEYTRELYKAHIDLKPLLETLFWIRVSLAPIVESIILLDRLLYLLEKGIHNAYLVKLFDLEISPRGFGLIAWKGAESALFRH